MTLHRGEVMNIAAQAADWLRVVRAGDPLQEAAFVRWLKESPLHVRETLLAHKVDQQLRRMDPNRQIDLERLFAQVSSNVLPMNAQSATSPVPSSHNRSRWLLAAAASVTIAAAGLVLQQNLSVLDGGYATKVGEQRNFALDDGSVVYLNTQSRMRVSFDDERRDIYLQDGQALFEVRRDTRRPFRVHAGKAVIQAIGTQFEVRRYTDRVVVAVVEGAVKVLPSEGRELPTTSGETSKLGAGESAVISDSGSVGPVTAIDATASTAWRQQQLVFENTPLTQIIGEFNRYNRTPQLRVEGSSVGAQQFNGVFNARSPESLLAYLAKHGSFAFERSGDEVVIKEK